MDKDILEVSVLRLISFIFQPFRLTNNIDRIVVDPQHVRNAGVAFITHMAPWAMVPRTESYDQSSTRLAFLMRLSISPWFAQNLVPIDMQRDVVRLLWKAIEDSPAADYSMREAQILRHLAVIAEFKQFGAFKKQLVAWLKWHQPWKRALEHPLRIAS